jgi:hypothetical protein
VYRRIVLGDTLTFEIVLGYRFPVIGWSQTNARITQNSAKLEPKTANRKPRTVLQPFARHVL